MTVNGRSVSHSLGPSPGTYYGCSDRVLQGTTPNEHGTWVSLQALARMLAAYGPLACCHSCASPPSAPLHAPVMQTLGRGGWCNGDAVRPWVADITAVLAPPGRPNTITYRGLLGNGTLPLPPQQGAAIVMQVGPAGREESCMVGAGACPGRLVWEERARRIASSLT